MANVTLQQVLNHMTGHTAGTPMQLNWNQHFRRVNQSVNGTDDAYTSVNFYPNVTFTSRPNPQGKHTLSRVRVRVIMSRAHSWYVNGRQTPLLLRHEQGHYNITFLVARQLCRRLLELEWDADVLRVTGINTSHQILTKLRTDAARLGRQAQQDSTRINNLYDDPARGTKNANGSINVNAQTRWENMINYAIQNDYGLPILIMLCGGNPRNW